MKTTIPNRTTLFLHRINGLVFILAGVLSISASASQLQYQRLKSFGDASLAGRNPSFHLIEGSDGALYGTTLYSAEVFDSGGVAFRVNKDGSNHTVPQHFEKNGDGHFPSTGLVEGNNDLL